MTFIKHKLGADLQKTDSNHAIVHNATIGLYEAINAPGFEKAMNDADTDAAILKLNADGYLGITSWRRPEPWEALTQMTYVAEGPMADLDLYPDAKEAWYWTSQEVPYGSSCVFVVAFHGGDVSSYDRHHEAFCRPVASASQ
jgi:hypothetical protein